MPIGRLAAAAVATALAVACATNPVTGKRELTRAGDRLKIVVAG